MFGFFKRKPTATDSINTCIRLADAANIDAGMEDGNYSGFLIYLDANPSSLAVHFKHQEALSAFIEAVENRISNGRFNDPGAGLDMVAEMRSMTDWKPNLDVVRAVIGQGNKPVFRWGPKG